MEAFCILLHFLFFGLVSSETSFVYNGFHNANLSLFGISYVRSEGILVVTSDSPNVLGRALYPSPLRFKENESNNSPVASFSTTFVFSISPQYPQFGGHGLAFVLLSTQEPKGSLANQYLGLPNFTSNAALSSTRVVAVEFDIVKNAELNDIDDNHVGIDICSLISNISKPAAYFTSNNSKDNSSIILKSGDPIQAWIEYTGKENLMNVTISPFGIPRSDQPLISFPVDLSSVLNEYMYVGFSASTGMLTAAHNVIGWSFRIGGRAPDLDPSELPSLVKPERVVHTKGFVVGITFACATLVLLVISGAIQVIRRLKHEDEVLEDWEVEYGARRFKYSELSAATRGFRVSNLIGTGGFGNVYKGVIPSTGLEVAIKRISHDSKQGMREFVAEITSMGRLRHRNLVQLHGWCRRKDQLLLVYDHFPNGSLDKLLSNTNNQKNKLTWEQRYKILAGIAQALLYLHEECEQRVVHRDVKPNNVLIDADLNAKLGDFGLARIYDHGIQSDTTNIVGTLGYLAPELTKTGKATTCTDVYGYGALMLEVSCGRRPIEPKRSAQELVLVDWVRELHSRGEIMRAVDPKLDFYNPDEVELVLSLGLLCSHPLPNHRPSMRRVVQFLFGDASLPQLPPDIHLEVPGLLPEFSDVYTDNSDPSSSRVTSSKTTSSFSSVEKNVVVNQGSKATV
ncbi:hypothetical protein HHK36_004149 [Tetracentron sinense]|uniref:non-specific serine/threonine protein kinase n=1 Tax=Tetracentron sinense TaxID=13715 RepID=A0A834ZZU6_TETSI|nr:hypothetical protein HHK36_004149 [Tetracentron sinense]